MKKKYLIITVAVLFTIFASCSIPTNPVNILLPMPYLEDFGGSIGKQYIVYTKEHFLYAMDELSMSGGSVGIKIMSDIDLSSGSGENTERAKIEGITSLAGTFDGNGKTISGFEIGDPSSSIIGLINKLEKGGVVKNLTISNAEVAGSGFTGVLVGWNNGGTIENCYNKGNIIGTGTYVGGIVGLNGGGNLGTVKDCHNTGSVTGESDSVGGIAGNSDGGSIIENCYNIGSISGTGDNVGGIVGYVADSTIENSYNTGNVSGMANNVGGVAGDNNTATVRNCYNTATVTGTGDNVGGIAGANRVGSTVQTCYNTGNVSSSGSDIGGVAGNNGGTIIICYFFKNATVNSLLNGIGNTLSDVNAEPYTVAQFANLYTISPFSALPWENGSGLIGVAVRPVLIGVGSGRDR